MREDILRLLKIGERNNKEVYCVISNRSTKHCKDYDDAASMAF